MRPERRAVSSEMISSASAWRAASCSRPSWSVSTNMRMRGEGRAQVVGDLVHEVGLELREPRLAGEHRDGRRGPGDGGRDEGEDEAAEEVVPGDRAVDEDQDPHRQHERRGDEDEADDERQDAAELHGGLARILVDPRPRRPGAGGGAGLPRVDDPRLAPSSPRACRRRAPAAFRWRRVSTIRSFSVSNVIRRIDPLARQLDHPEPLVLALDDLGDLAGLEPIHDAPPRRRQLAPVQLAEVPGRLDARAGGRGIASPPPPRTASPPPRPRGPGRSRAVALAEDLQDVEPRPDGVAAF